MAVASIAKSHRKTIVADNPVARAGIEHCDQMRAFLKGAVSILKGSDAWETTAAEIEVVYLIEAAMKIVEKLDDDFDRALLVRGEAHHG